MSDVWKCYRDTLLADEDEPIESGHARRLKQMCDECPHEKVTGGRFRVCVRCLKDVSQPGGAAGSGGCE